MIALAIGLMIGFAFGMVITACLVAASRDDEIRAAHAAGFREGFEHAQQNRLHALSDMTATVRKESARLTHGFRNGGLGR